MTTLLTQEEAALARKLEEDQARRDLHDTLAHAHGARCFERLLALCGAASPVTSPEAAALHNLAQQMLRQGMAANPIATSQIVCRLYGSADALQEDTNE